MYHWSSRPPTDKRSMKTHLTYRVSQQNTPGNKRVTTCLHMWQDTTSAVCVEHTVVMLFHICSMLPCSSRSLTGITELKNEIHWSPKISQVIVFKQKCKPFTGCSPSNVRIICHSLSYIVIFLGLGLLMRQNKLIWRHLGLLAHVKEILISVLIHSKHIH